MEGRKEGKKKGKKEGRKERRKEGKGRRKMKTCLEKVKLFFSKSVVRGSGC